MKKAHKNALLEQNSAIGSYLDEMLQQATNGPEQIDTKSVESETDKTSLISESPISEQEVLDPPVIAETGISAEPESEFDKEVADETDVSANSGSTVTEEQPHKALDIELFPLQCLMFRVGGSSLSIPLIHLNGIATWSDKLTHLPQSPQWLIGLLKYRERNIRVVDSGQILGIPSVIDSQPENVLLLENGDWSITCDKLENVVTLEYEDVQWHENTENKMMIGTIRESLTLLLSPTAIIDSLSDVNSGLDLNLEQDNSDA